mmetsp:Transcript_2201/g.6191  ORF Transcript_2201/g.6191 Transcript_2201/m.6191 type:complete len:298 (-) Transcript_2201:624-1517(-)
MATRPSAPAWRRPPSRRCSRRVWTLHPCSWCSGAWPSSCSICVQASWPSPASWATRRSSPWPWGARASRSPCPEPRATTSPTRRSPSHPARSCSCASSSLCSASAWTSSAACVARSPCPPCARACSSLPPRPSPRQASLADPSCSSLAPAPRGPRVSLSTRLALSTRAALLVMAFAGWWQWAAQRCTASARASVGPSPSAACASSTSSPRAWPCRKTQSRSSQAWLCARAASPASRPRAQAPSICWGARAGAPTSWTRSFGGARGTCATRPGSLCSGPQATQPSGTSLLPTPSAASR